MQAARNRVQKRCSAGFGRWPLLCCRSKGSIKGGDVSRTTIPWCAIGAWLGWSLALPADAAPLYQTGGDCDGYPRVGLQTAPGLCVGLVASGLGFARGVVAQGEAIYVADMGGWHANRGRILRLERRGAGKPVVVLQGLNEPNSLVQGPDGSIYVGLSGKVIRFDPRAAAPSASVREVLTNLPASGRHPLAAMAFGADGSLYRTVGSATDHCEGADGRASDPAQAGPELLEEVDDVRRGGAVRAARAPRRPPEDRDHAGAVDHRAAVVAEVVAVRARLGGLRRLVGKVMAVELGGVVGERGGRDETEREDQSFHGLGSGRM